MIEYAHVLYAEMFESPKLIFAQDPISTFDTSIRHISGAKDYMQHVAAQDSQ